MLTHLHIQNYALIGHLDIDFSKGFAAITGETGAGKSIILGALSLVMGAKADAKCITEGEEHCIIEADFGDYLIRRELHQNGRSRSFINDEVATQQELKTLAARLIDIHSQHANLLIENSDFQLSIVDAIAQNQPQRTAYTIAYEEYIQAQQALNDLLALANKTQQDADYIEFQYNQLVQANLEKGELEALEKEQYQLNHTEENKHHLQEVLSQLNDDQQGASMLIHACNVECVSSELNERLRSVDVELKDIISDLERIYERTEYDPVRLQNVEERLDLINTLLRKHQVQTVDELIAIRDTFGQQINQIQHFDEQIEAHQCQLQQKTALLSEKSQTLSASRHAVCQTISQQLMKDLCALSIPHAKVEVSIEPLPDFTPSGSDNVQFLFAANLNQSLRPIREVASGGEISRFMLCVKALIASTNGLPTIIFDEIDAGVSGEVATQMGKIMRQMAQTRQIIAITHLPQIAAQAETQYCVYKQDTQARTETHIRQLQPEERVQEIASMLAGKSVSEATLETAKQLLCYH